MFTIEKLIRIANTPTVAASEHHHESTLRIAAVYELMRMLLVRGVPTEVVIELCDSLQKATKPKTSQRTR